MPSDDDLTRASKVISLLSELGKLLAMGAAALFMVGALAAPGWIKDRLQALDLKVSDVNIGIIKLVAAQAPKASIENMRAAEVLTRLEVAVSDTVPPDKSGALLKDIREAKKALDAQSQSLVAVAGAAGLEPQVPATAWVYVGYFTESGAVGRLADRVDANGMSYAGGKLRSLVLKHDVTVSANGDDCTKTEIANVPAFDPASLTRKLVVLEGSPSPIQVIRTAECPAAGRGKTVFAEVQVPAARVRFAELGALKK